MKLLVMLVSLSLSAPVLAGLTETPPVDTGFDTLDAYHVEGTVEYLIKDRLSQRCYLYRGNEEELQKLEPTACPK